MAKTALINKQKKQPVPRARLHAVPAVRPLTRCTASSCSAGSASVSSRTSGAAGGDSIMVMTKAKFSSNVSDPVADLLTRIRNANLAFKDDGGAGVEARGLGPQDPGRRGLHHRVLAREGEGVHQAFRIRLKYGASAARDHRSGDLEAGTADLPRPWRAPVQEGSGSRSSRPRTE